MSRKNAIRESARDEDCQIRLPGVCNFNPKTTVLAHLNGGGAGMKNYDIHASYACSDCHDAVDHRVNHRIADCDLELWFYHGVKRTQSILVAKGLLTWEGQYK